MDELMQSTGIDAGTVIVLTGTSNRILQMSRAYFNFRYWGFPRCRLKMLDGFSEDYEAWVKANVDAGFTLETTAPSPAPRSSYSVCELTQNTSLRAPLEEMINVAEDDDDNTVVIDARRIDEYDGNLGSTPGSCETTTEVVMFEGHIRTALSKDWTSLLSDSGGIFMSKADLTTAMTSIGVDSSKATYVYCVIGFRASALFFVLDAVLRWPAKIYDGSWKEWGQMAPPNLDTASQWRTDTPARSGIVNYNTAATCSIDANSLAFHADGVNQTDSTICGGDGDGDGPPIVPGY
jgi:3-mercaptopyruvate sulfurtransferase SseA